MDKNHLNNLQTCQICGVSITEKGQVNFSNGSPGTRARLYARVCKYAKRPECINQEPELIGEITAQDGYESGKGLIPSFGNTEPTN
ncbi:hypothetical protein Xen7305DRAFT_00015770 [Xenococcus sp. PCC 7305]|uniref:hypothetical protein n=1 Tax=Xenococcus sp. PCC 7305 TaxID=102125 RepID=UPI0002AC647A|nr:hypothetical protein [Xenococcus sp. PCC 7305]ELS01870.1 hypothetical protein Xen7305DRAFT_00015770 [Xenococcus sp. PCC 7305]